MTATPRFFPYHPRATRLALAAGALCCAAVTALALRGAAAGTEHFAEARAGLSAGLGFAFLFVFFRLRPRAGWGVTVTPSGLSLSKPLSTEAPPLEVPWDQVEQARVAGARPTAVVVFLKNDQRVVIPRHLFASAGSFRALSDAILEAAPAPRFDA